MGDDAMMAFLTPQGDSSQSLLEQSPQTMTMNDTLTRQSLLEQKGFSSGGASGSGSLGFLAFQSNAVGESSTATPGGASPDVGGTPMTFSDVTMRAQNSAERFNFINSVQTGLTPRPKSAPVSAPRNRTSRNDFYERMMHTKSKYEQRRHERRVAQARKEEDFSFRPTISAKSALLARGNESLEERMCKITEARESKLANARSKGFEKEYFESLSMGRPSITEKGSRMQRGYEALLKWDESKKKKRVQRETQRDQESLEECTFQPKSSGSTSEERQKLFDSRQKASDTLLRQEAKSFSSRLEQDSKVHNRLYENTNSRRWRKIDTDGQSGTEANIRASTAPGLAKAGAGNPNEPSSASTTPTTPRLRSSKPDGVKRAAKTEATATRIPTDGANSKQPVPFDAFMRSLASEPQWHRRQLADWSPTSTQFEDMRSVSELGGESSFMSRGTGRAAPDSPAPSPRSNNSQRYGIFAAMMSDTEDEIFMAALSPRPSPYPQQFAKGSQERSQSPVAAGRSSVNEDTPPNSVILAPPRMFAAHSAVPTWTHTQNKGGVSPPQKEENVMTFTNNFEDVFRLGYGGALPGTLRQESQLRKSIARGS
jgi:hypothetical protein